MMIKNYLKLIRFQNLMLLALMQLVFRFGFLKIQKEPVALALSDWQYILLVLSTVLIAAGGYIINNIMDQSTDADNKPNQVIVGRLISESQANLIYVILTTLGVGIGFYLSNVILKPFFATIFIVIAVTLYLYATSFKQSLLVGNVLVALLLASSVLIIGVFDLMPATADQNRPMMAMYFGILIDYAVFAFVLNFVRELIKDIEDVNGDYNQGMNTLPIVLGVSRSTKIVFGLSFIPLALILHYIYAYLFNSNLIISTIYGLIFVIAPFLYYLAKLWSAKKTKDFHHLSTVLKWIMFFGIMSILVITINMKLNA